MYYILVKDGIFFVVSPDMTEVNRFYNYDEAQDFCNNLNLMNNRSNNISNPNFGIRNNGTTEFGTSEFVPFSGMNKIKPNNTPLVNYGEIVFNYGEDMTQEHNNLMHNNTHQNPNDFIVNKPNNYNCNHHGNNQSLGCENCANPSGIDYNNSLNMNMDYETKNIEEPKRLSFEEQKLKELEIREKLERLKALEKQQKNKKQKVIIQQVQVPVPAPAPAPIPAPVQETAVPKKVLKEEKKKKKKKIKENRNVSDSDEFLTTDDIRNFITKLKK